MLNSHRAPLPLPFLLAQKVGAGATSQAGHALKVQPGPAGSLVVADLADKKQLGVGRTKQLCDKVMLVKVRWVRDAAPLARR